MTLIVGLWAASARAENLESPAEKDGLWVTLGPVLSVTHVEDEWLSAVGGELSVIGIREHCLPAAVGVSAGGVSFGGREGGRLYLEGEVALNRPLPFAIGMSAGVVAEVDAVRVPRWGMQGTLWAFAYVVPYVRVGTVEESGGFVEVGVMLKIPARRLVNFH